MNKIIIYMLLAGLLLGVSATEVMADGTETLGNPSIAISAGSGIIAKGIGLATVQPGIINIDVPAGSTIKQVLLYWEGQHTTVNGDNTIVINGNTVTGSLIGGPTLFFSNVKSSTYRADITSLNLISSGPNTLEVKGLNFGYANDGAGILVIYDDGINKKDIQLRDGNDLAYFDFSPTLDTTVEQNFVFSPVNYDRTASLTMFFSSVEGAISGFGFRPSAINITIGGITTSIIDQLNSIDGDEWDTLVIPVDIPAGATSLKVQALSIDLPGGKTGRPASFAWNAAALSLSLPASIGDRVWIDVNKNGIQDSGEMGYNGARVNLMDCGGNTLATTTTNSTGYYLFSGLKPGNYNILFALPNGHSFSPQDQGGDDAKDSDANTSTGMTMCTTLDTGEVDMTWDAGIYEACGAIGDGSLIFEKNKVDWIIKNTGSNPIIINSIALTWPSSNKKLKKVKVNNLEIFATAQAPPSAVISMWKSGTETIRTIAPGVSATLRFEFEANAAKAGAYNITVNFDKGCSVEFKPGIGPKECGPGTSNPSGFKIGELDLKYNTDPIAFCDSQNLGYCNNQPWMTKWFALKGTGFGGLGGGDDRIIASDGGSMVWKDQSSIKDADIILIKASSLGATTLKAATYVKVYDANTISDPKLIENIMIHTSCSQPIRVGDKYGSFEIVDMALVGN